MPITVLALNALSGQPECVGKRQWLGIGFAVSGVYLVAGQGVGATTETLLGDALTMAVLWSWAGTPPGRELCCNATRRCACRPTPRSSAPCATRLSACPDLLRLDWGAVSGGAWAALVVSGLLAFSVAHIIWYTGVRRLGSARTAVYGNLVPVTAMAVALNWLHEPIGAMRLLGATLVLMGLVPTRMERSTACAPV